MKQQARLIRRLAMQMLYQIDLAGEQEAAELLEGVEDSELDADERQTAVDLALAAWVQRETADAVFAELAPDWPTHRQPPVDRAILRLAHYELASERVSARVAINEAVELAKAFCAEDSPAFVNALLDKAAHRLVEAGRLDPSATEGLPEPPALPQGETAWLADALKGEAKP
ncbi:MAG: transcription antitermination factor NusB [Phycisphaeraceae bacterium]